MILEVGGRQVPVRLIRHAGARRMSLRVDPIKGEVRVTIPPRARLCEAKSLIDRHRMWIARRVEELPVPLPFAPGAVFPIEGVSVVLDWSIEHPRMPQLDGDRLQAGGPLDRLESRITAWLKKWARDCLETETVGLAIRARTPVESVRVGDAQSRWGSCSIGRVIAYNWRLILAPVWVRHSVVAHEVAHLTHHDHSSRFHALHRELLGDDPRPARDWLAQHGAQLHWIGRG